MVALNLATGLPSNINTVERLHAWSTSVLQELNPTLVRLEIANQLPELVAQRLIFPAADGNTVMVARLSLPVDPSYGSDNTKKLWMFVNEITNQALPDRFKSN